MSRQTFNELLQSISADPTAVGNSTAETILVPDFTFPANYFIQGTTIRGTGVGRVSNQAVANNQTFRVHFGTATLSATAIFTSGVLASNATANTNLTWRFEWTAVCRTSGTGGTIMLTGQIWLPNLVTGTTVGLVGYPALIPVTAPATQTIDTTVANVLSNAWTHGTANAANTVQMHNYHLESLN